MFAENNNIIFRDNMANDNHSLTSEMIIMRLKVFAVLDNGLVHLHALVGGEVGYVLVHLRALVGEEIYQPVAVCVIIKKDSGTQKKD